MVAAEITLGHTMVWISAVTGTHHQEKKPSPIMRELAKRKVLHP